MIIITNASLIHDNMRFISSYNYSGLTYSYNYGAHELPHPMLRPKITKEFDEQLKIVSDIIISINSLYTQNELRHILYNLILIQLYMFYFTKCNDMLVYKTILQYCK